MLLQRLLPCITRPARSLLLAIVVLLTGTAHAELKTFRVEAAQAKQVYLAGEMTTWDSGKKLMDRDKNGRWNISVDLQPGIWLYKFVVDGQWLTDPGTTLNDNDGQGGRHSFVFAGEGPWNERTDVAHGEVQALMLPSKAWGKPVKLNVYLPPGFKKGQAYPVLLLLHGQGMDADQWYKTGHIHHYMDNLLAQKKIEPFVVVMPSSEKVSYVAQSERFITEELPQWLDTALGLKPGRKAFAVAGMSMGGFGAFHLPLAHAEKFGFGFALSGFYPDSYVKNLPRAKTLPFSFMMLCGSDDGLVGTNRALAAALKKQGAEFYYRENPGAHSFHYWSSHTEEMLRSVNTFFSGGTVPHNSATLSLASRDEAQPVPVVGREIEPTPELIPRMLGLWRGEWIVAGGVKGGYEENLTLIEPDRSEGTFSVMDAGPDSKIDEPFVIRTRVENGRGHFINPDDGSDVTSILSEENGRLWRQWRVKHNGMDVLLRVARVENDKR